LIDILIVILSCNLLKYWAFLCFFSTLKRLNEPNLGNLSSGGVRLRVGQITSAKQLSRSLDFIPSSLVPIGSLDLSDWFELIISRDFWCSW